jgi:hypothetical protein
MARAGGNRAASIRETAFQDRRATLPGAQPGVVSLLVGGMVYEGWEEVEVRISKKKMSGESTRCSRERQGRGVGNSSTTR